MHSVLQHYTQTQIEKASGIKCIVTDVDGVLTDGGITYDNQGSEYKKFNAKDGLIVGFLRAAGFKVGAITGRSSAIVEGRSRELKFDFLYQDAEDKLEPFEEIKIKFNLTNQEIAYIGDDILDLPLIVQSGLGVAPADAHNYIQKQADLITMAKGGEGVFREVADLLLASQGKLETVVNKYGEIRTPG